MFAQKEACVWSLLRSPGRRREGAVKPPLAIRGAWEATDPITGLNDNKSQSGCIHSTSSSCRDDVLNSAFTRTPCNLLWFHRLYASTEYGPIMLVIPLYLHCGFCEIEWTIPTALHWCYFHFSLLQAYSSYLLFQKLYTSLTLWMMRLTMDNC